MNKILGFIGCGNMAKAMIGGIIDSNLMDKNNIYASASSQKSVDKIKETLAINAVYDNCDVAKNCDIIVLAVKPYQYEMVIEEIRDYVKEDVMIVTIAPGKTLEFIKDKFQKNIKVIRTMPNTPAMVLEGMTAYCVNELVSEEDESNLKAILSSFGKCEKIAEYLMDAVVGVSGSSPAYVYMFIEALADGAVAAGMPRAAAYKFAAQAVLGSAKMVLETGLHPAVLKDQVCSPAGSTIVAVEALEENGMRNSVMKAVAAAVKKSSSM